MIQTRPLSFIRHAIMPVNVRSAWQTTKTRYQTRSLLKSAPHLARPLEEVLTLIDRIKAQEALDSVRRMELSSTRALLSSNVIPLAELHHVSADATDADLHQAILAKEAVHIPVGGVEELQKLRFGTPDQQKDCQTLVIPHASGRRLIGQILRYHFSAATDSQNRVYVNTLEGRVDDVKTSPLKSLTGDENVIGYYSISADFNIKAAGKALIASLIQANPKGKLEATISPIREIINPEKGGYDRDALLNLSDDDIRRKVLEFISRKIDMPSRSHLDNGAFIGWIHINRDSEKDPITVNYIYDRNLLTLHRANYHQGVLPVSNPLRVYSAGNFIVSPSQRVAPALKSS